MQRCEKLHSNKSLKCTLSKVQVKYIFTRMYKLYTMGRLMIRADTPIIRISVCLTTDKICQLKCATLALMPHIICKASSD